MRFRNRHAVWLAAVVLVAGSWFLAPRSRITFANFLRIELGMAEKKVKAVLGDASNVLLKQEFNRPRLGFPFGTAKETYALVEWRNEATYMIIEFKNGEVAGKQLHEASASETLSWYFGQAAKKVGLK